MIQLILSASLGLALLSAGAHSPAFAADEPKAEAKTATDSTLLVKLRVPRDMEFAKVQRIIRKVQALGDTKFTVRVSKEGEGISAEVEAEPRIPSKRIAAVVEVLLDGGITKISVERKK